MTREEAKQTLSAIKFTLDNNEYSEDVEEALNMAIEALSAQPEISIQKIQLENLLNKLSYDIYARDESGHICLSDKARTALGEYADEAEEALCK